MSVMSSPCSEDNPGGLTPGSEEAPSGQQFHGNDRESDG